MIVNAGGEPVELLAYDIPSDSLGARLCGFEIFGRRRAGGDFDQQLASGLVDTLEEAKALALTMAKQPRATRTVLPFGEQT